MKLKHFLPNSFFGIGGVKSVYQSINYRFIRLQKIAECYIVACLTDRFALYFIVPTLKYDDIITTHNVQSEVECSFYCLDVKGCVGFKYKYTTSIESVNCQLSYSTGNSGIGNFNDHDWVFFVDVKHTWVSKFNDTRNFLLGHTKELK